MKSAGENHHVSGCCQRTSARQHDGTTQQINLRLVMQQKLAFVERLDSTGFSIVSRSCTRWFDLGGY